MAHDVFISHSSKDKNAADAICHALENNGIKCWIAPRDVSPGAEYAGELTGGIKNCKIFLLVFSRESNTSRPVSKEIETAFRYEKTVLPYRIEDVEMRESLEYYLANLHWLDAFPDDKGFEPLIKAVKNTLGLNSVNQAVNAEPEPVHTPPPAPLQAQPQQNLCVNCRTPLADGESFCTFCGAKSEISPAAPVQQTQAQYTQPVQQPQYIPPVQQQPVQQQFTQPVQQQYSAQQPVQQQYVQPEQQYAQQQYSAFQPVQQPPVKPGKGKLIAIISSAAAVVVAGVIGAILLFGGNDDEAIPAGLDNEKNIGQEESNPKKEEKPAQPEPAEPIVLTPAQIFENNKNAVFQIKLYEGNVHTGWGSGFFISESGTAVTCHHVMADASSAAVVLYDGSELDITGYFSYDAENDIAIIKVDGKGKAFDYITIGDSADVHIGDNVFAVGGPDGDPITFTSGIISRFATEPLSYSGYTVAGMLQSTAAIYGGNSGGPLLNDKGHVIGINSAGRSDRDSMQWAVPIDRIDVPRENDSVKSLPISDSVQVQFDGRISFLRRYPFIPDFLSVSPTAELIMAGTAADFEYDTDYDYFYYYDITELDFFTDTDKYDDVLRDYGFILQDFDNYYDDDGDEIYDVYLYHAGEDTSINYYFWPDYELMVIAVGSGNLYELYFGDNNGGGGTQQTPADVRGYARFPDVPDFGLIAEYAEFILSDYAENLGLEEDVYLKDDLYICPTDYIYCYTLPLGHSTDETSLYEYDYLKEIGFELEYWTIVDDIYAALYSHSGKGIDVSVIYLYDDEECWIVIGEWN
ncbi:MAG: trypsin-like peptidase domain-containing protein [Oscillospiraceae bacterium]|nr:trypsin-like peptidase domain-containing protein [Oscillospiraceae bacterium]